MKLAAAHLDTGRAQALARYLLKGFDPGSIAHGSIALAILALACELPVLFARSLLLQIALDLCGLLLQVHVDGLVGDAVLLSPFVWPALGLLCPFPSGWWWRQAEGGRAPSPREQIAYQDSIQLLASCTPQQLCLPRDWFVLDSPMPEAAVCAETLMLSRTLLESDCLTAVLAHELGHLATSDGRLTTVLNRLLIRRRPKPHTTEHGQSCERATLALSPPLGGSLIVAVIWLLFAAARLLVGVARGGYGLRLLAPILGGYWREREYHADDYAAGLGQAEELADFLEANALALDQPVPFVWLTEHSHPPTELRISRLRAHAEQESDALVLEAG